MISIKQAASRLPNADGAELLNFRFVGLQGTKNQTPRTRLTVKDITLVSHCFKVILILPQIEQHEIIDTKQGPNRS